MLNCKTYTAGVVVRPQGIRWREIAACASQTYRGPAGRQSGYDRYRATAGAEPREGEFQFSLCGRSVDRRPCADKDSPRRKFGHAWTRESELAQPTPQGCAPTVARSSASTTRREFRRGKGKS